MKRTIALFLVMTLVLSSLCMCKPAPESSASSAKVYRTETVYDPLAIPATTMKKIKVYKSDLTSQRVINKKKVTLPADMDITIVGEKTEDSKKWFKILFPFGEKNVTGYVRNTVLTLNNTEAVKGTVIGVAKTLPLRKEAGGDEIVKDGSSKVKIPLGTAVGMLSEATIGTVRWYNISVTLGKKSYTGYVKAKFVKFTKNKRKIKIYALTAAEFEEEMTKQEIPEYYKQYLRALHEEYPFWEFRIYKTGLKWSTVLKAESKVGVNLISNAKSEAWKSKDPEAYNEKTGTWKVFDGTSWVAASKEAVAYYMDPRNFLNERTIFQFELLGYQKGFHKASAVDRIFANTPFANKSFSYKNITTGKKAKMTYTNAYMAAAKESGVSPLHLSSRTKQEVVTSATTTSIAVTGTNKKYPSIYNFYNIGAYNGTNPALNGLKWASEGTTYLRPWSDPYRSIVGGATYIGQNYINRGQNTVYLEKFDVTPYETYDHQYMSNVEGAYSESLKVRKAYEECGLLKKTPLVFSIPVYEKMPEKVCAAPT